MKLYFVIKDGKCPWSGYKTFEEARDFANFILYINWMQCKTPEVLIELKEADENGICRDY